MHNDNINYDYKGSVRVDKMSRSARAAQFSSFAALTGYDEMVDLASRFTQERGEVSEETAEHINECLEKIMDSYPQRIKAKITYFVPDEKKQGGSYQVIEGDVRRIDECALTVIFEEGRAVPIEDISDIDIVS